MSDPHNSTDAYADALQAQNEGGFCEHCNSISRHFRNCPLICRETAEAHSVRLATSPKPIGSLLEAGEWRSEETRMTNAWQYQGKLTRRLARAWVHHCTLLGWAVRLQRTRKGKFHTWLRITRREP